VPWNEEKSQDNMEVDERADKNNGNEKMDDEQQTAKEVKEQELQKQEEEEEAKQMDDDREQEEEEEEEEEEDNAEVQDQGFKRKRKGKGFSDEFCGVGGQMSYQRMQETNKWEKAGSGSGLSVELSEQPAVVVDFPAEASKKKSQKIIFTKEEERLFHKRLFALVQRYASISINELSGLNSGFYKSLTEGVFTFLQEKCGVAFEGFASPFDCHFRYYCSMFQDTDQWFGSLGSFFDIQLVEGSFELTPPNLEDLMELMVNRVREYLKNAKERGKINGQETPLSFFIMLPDWNNPPTAAITMLQGESFLEFMRYEIKLFKKVKIGF